MIYLIIYLITVTIALFAVYCYNKEGEIEDAPKRFDWSGWWPKVMVFMPVVNTFVLVAGLVFYVMMTIYYFGR